jgi:hypothetical protein
MIINHDKRSMHWKKEINREINETWSVNIDDSSFTHKEFFFDFKTLKVLCFINGHSQFRIHAQNE